ncbi:hypothetical protein BCR41DRAFT_366749 [Lobosporangium transversale]|uniref:Uncharacterized protein n=1 Tax=Lobosporangium transversale TaxID=64571 RepID=A0A1Y2H3G9_9FUNG|nr:hypothetical protein BCR41DRAFT_366749 [Lobosporangium transversale]ORZ29097.1 hypothetical protein BCR41DRAFT_366749 [Lobosporangium transversale]|eukprot:XP_021886770.1 hypothetical protein BCR41DRAFT_366749 [Lobosporangium transversale]
MTTNIPPPPKEALPQPPLQLDLCFSQSYSANHANQKQQRHQQPPHSAPVVTSFPSPSQHRFHSQPFSPQSYEPASPPASGIVPSLRSMGSQANMSQNIDNTAYCLHASLSSLSLTPSVNSLGHQPELTRIASNGSNSSIKRPASLTSRHTVPVVKAVMDIKTAEVLSSLTFEDMPRCYVVAPPIVASSSGPFTPFRIVAPCQALGVRGQNTIHFPEHQGYTVNNAEEVMKTHGTVLQHFANLASLFAGASDSSFGKSLGKHAERFLKNVKPTTRVPLMKDTKELSTGVDGTSVQIEKFMTEHLHLESIAQLMRDITKSNTASDWAGGLQRIVSPGTGRSMWVCQDCFTGLQLGRYEWNDEQASLDDLIGYPDKTGAKSEAHLLNATAVDVYTQMIRGQSRIRNAVINILPAYFEAPERKATAMFSANQKLIQNLAKVLTEAHLTMVEINANQTRDSELMDKDNIYLHVRRLFSCYQLEYVKLSGLPFLLREKLPGFLDHAKFLSFDGVLVDNDKAVSNMKKLITENSDMEHLALTRAQMTSTGLKVLCSAHKNLRRIARLDLSNNRIDAEGIKELANQVMPTSLDLRFLDLSDNPKIGTVGCLSLLKAIWPASSHATRQKNLVSLQLANTGFCDEAASQLSRNIDGPSGIGALYNINLSGNQITKPGLLALMTCVSQNAHQSPLRKLSLSQHVSALSIPGAMDYEVVHFFGVHPTLTHLTLSKLSLGMVAQIVNLNKCLISLTVDDVVCVSPQDPHFALSCFNSLCQSIASNTVMQDLKIRSPWSFWALAFQSTGAAPNSSEQESNWLDAAGWMAVIENSLQRNTVLRCFQMRGVTNFEEELVLATAMAPPSITSPGSIFGGSLGRYGGSGMLGASEVARTDGESKMMALSQNIRMYLERNQVLYYGRKHGIEEQLINQY